MLDVEKEFKTLQNHMNRYKTKRLSFECGVATGFVTAINLVDNPYYADGSKVIEVRGIAGFDAKEQVLMTITDLWRKGVDYKYWRDYHILEYFPDAAYR